MLEGIIYRYRCGIAWRDVPEVFGPWQTIWTWHRRMSAEGTWDLVLARLLATADQAGIIDWSVSVDSTIARAHQHATNITRRNCQYLWIGVFQATSVSVDSAGSGGVMSAGRSSSLPLWKTAPARTRATRWGALTARHRACAASISL